MQPRKEFVQILAETVHTAFRKGCENGHDVHEAIKKMPNKDWGDAVEWMAWAIEECGYEIKKKGVDP